MFFGFCWVASLIAFFAGDWRIASREPEKAELPVPEVEAEVQGGETSKRMFSRRRSSTSSKNPGSGGSVPVGHYKPAIPRFKWSPRWSTTEKTSSEGSVGGGRALASELQPPNFISQASNTTWRYPQGQMTMNYWAGNKKKCLKKNILKGVYTRYPPRPLLAFSVQRN